MIKPLRLDGCFDGFHVREAKASLASVYTLLTVRTRERYSTSSHSGPWTCAHPRRCPLRHRDTEVGMKYTPYLKHTV